MSSSDLGSSAAGTGIGDVPPTFDSTLGAVLIGGFVSIFLYGVTCLQVFIYHQRYPNDRRSVRNFVYLIWMIDSFDAALTVQICYHYLISNFANPVAILSPVWSLKLHVLVTSVSDFVVRCLFAKRIYTLSHGNRLITSSILALSVVDLVVGTIITARAFQIPTFAGLVAVAHLFYLNFASNIAADSGVAIVLSYYLWTNRTGSRRTDSLIVKLILYTVNTGLITVVDATLGLICYATRPTTLIFIAFYLNLSKFYVNSYLASLNVRKTLLSSIKTAHAGGFGGEDGPVSIHLSHTNSPGMTQNMPSFRNVTGMTASGMSGMTGMFELGAGTAGLLSVPERSGIIGGPRMSLNRGSLDLDTAATSDSIITGGGVSTAVNTPIDGYGLFSSKEGQEKAEDMGETTEYPPRLPPGIEHLARGIDEHEVDPESCYAAVPALEEAQENAPIGKDQDLGSEPPSPTDC